VVMEMRRPRWTAAQTLRPERYSLLKRFNNTQGK